MKLRNQHRWYAVRMAFECRVAERCQDWEDRIVLFQARTEKELLRKAMSYGKKESHSYENSHHRTVTWKFSGLVDTHELTDNERPSDGSEIWYEYACRSMTRTAYVKRIGLARPDRKWRPHRLFAGWIVKKLETKS